MNINLDDYPDVLNIRFELIPMMGAKLDNIKADAIKLCATTGRDVEFTFNKKLYYISRHHLFKAVQENEVYVNPGFDMDS